MKRASKHQTPSEKPKMDPITAENNAKISRTSSFSDYDTDNQMKSEEETMKNTTTKTKEPITLKKVISRSITASFLALLYLSIVWAGHFYCILAVALSQVCNIGSSLSIFVFIIVISAV